MSESRYGEPGAQHHQGVWRTLNRLMVALILFAVVILAVCAFVPELKRQREQTARLEQLKADIEKQKAILAQRTREIDLLKNDPGYLETLARDRLDMMKEGETVYRIEPQTSEKAEPTPARP